VRFCSLGSGSSGNATLVEAGDGARTTRLLIDCGLSLRELTRRLALRGCSPAELSAVFVTHEHGDHVGCVQTLMRRHRVPAWMSAGTWRAVGGDAPCPPGLQFARDGEPIELNGQLVVHPYAVPHDAREPLQLTVFDGRRRLGVLTDIGSETSAVVQALQGCSALLLECNHDSRMLADGDYPASLKRRIAGPRGHLSNAAAAGILTRCRHDGLRHVVAAHLSERNNRPALAAGTLAQVLGTAADDILVADPLHGSPWLDLH
jgi:phosphoribosyl 1,2-cyclic phosphodiesterase